jgi:PAS domain S-box-containing protein
MPNLAYQAIIKIVNLKASTKWVLFIAVCLGYWLLMPYMAQTRFTIAFRFFMLIYLGMAAAFWGVRGGFLASVTNAVINPFLLDWLDILYLGGFLVPAWTITGITLIGLIVDLGRDLAAQTEKNALNEHALRLHRNHLDQLVREKTQELTMVNKRLETEISEKEVIRAQLAESEHKYRSIVEHAYEGIGVFQNTSTRYMNPYAISVLGYSEQEILTRPFTDFIHPDDLEISMQRHLDRMAGIEAPQNYLVRIINKAGEIIWVRVNGVRIDWEGEPATLNFLRDVTAMMKTESDLKAALAEKETLLREIHHRVKNNMQIISSLLNLQSYQIQDEGTRLLFEEAQARVRAMALAHEVIYQSESISMVNLADYLPQLCQSLLSAHNLPNRHISMVTDIADIELELSRSVPCGLIVNELVTNSLKHGFPKEKNGQISLTARLDDSTNVVLEVSDTGTGLTDETDFNNPQTLGLRLVRLITEQQLNGRIEYASQNGARFSVTFPISAQQSGI